jgi:MEMO1 family protein
MTLDPGDKPKLRNVEPVAVVVQGRQAIGLKDHLGLADRMVCVQRDALPVLSLLNGMHTLRDIQWTLSRHSGRLVLLDDVRGLVEMLDEACLLEGERFKKAYNHKLVEYRRRPFRNSSHAGTSYSGDPDDLRRELNQYFTADGGPGEPTFCSEARRPVGLIAPHIDIRAGGRCFAKAYHALAAGQPSDVYVILGTGHAGVEGMFTCTSLDFQTPLGTARTDSEFVEEFGRRLGRDPAAEEILHASEHVIEFQVVFLQLLFSGGHPFTIVPILCSLSHRIFSGSEDVRAEKALFDEVCSALKETSRQSSKSVCFIASADLDHIGPRYGDSFIPHRGTVADALEKDTQLLAHLERMDLDAFVAGVARDNDGRRICGFSPITTMFHAMDATEGTVLALDYAQVDDKNSFVSFTSMIFH